MTTFLSDADEWDRLYRLWNKTDITDTLRNINNSIDYLNNVVLRDPRLSPIPTPSTAGIKGFETQMSDLAEYCKTIHDMVEDKIDIPFRYGLAKAADAALMINPDDLTSTGPTESGTHISIIDIIAPLTILDADLKKAFEEAVINAADIRPSADLKQAIVDAITRFGHGKDVSGFSDDEKRILIYYYEMLFPAHEKIMDDFLTPLSNAGLNDDIRNIKFISYTSPEPYRQLMFHCLPSARIVNVNASDQMALPKVPILGSTIFVDLNRGVSDLRGPYFTFFHEVGHAVDYILIGGFWPLHRTELQNTASNDVMDNISNTIMSVGVTPAEHNAVKNAILENDESKLSARELNIFATVIQIYRDRLLDSNNIPLGSAANATVTDVYGGFTNNTLRLDSYGHSVEVLNVEIYWGLGGAVNFQSLELFAGHFAANVTGYESHLEGLREFFPNSTKMINEQLTSLASKVGG